MQLSRIFFKNLICNSLVFFFFTGSLMAQQKPDTLQRGLQVIRQQLTGFEERLVTVENDLYKLTKIKISGYLQADWTNFENSAMYPYNTFTLTRARFKIRYEPYSGVAFVLEPDLTPRGVTLKDAYGRLNDPWLNTFSLWAGQFNKLNYEVEVSNSQLDVLTRSMVVRILYPGERGIGAKLEAAPPRGPFQVELAVFNGNENMVIKDAFGENINQANVDFDPFKDINARVVYHFRLGNSGGLDIGASGYYGKIRSNSTVLLRSDYTFDRQVEQGKGITRGWGGLELRLYLDILGGFALKSECLMGVNAAPGYANNATYMDPAVIDIIHDTLNITNLTHVNYWIGPSIRRNFIGGYVYLIKNIGRKHKLAVRWDYYDPNTSLTGDQLGLVKYDDSEQVNDGSSVYTGGNPVVALHTVTETTTSNSLKSGTADLAYQTVSIAWSYYLTDNITLQAAYDIPLNEKTGTNASGEGNVRKTFTVNGMEVVNDYSKVFPQNLLILRLQVKF